MALAVRVLGDLAIDGLDVRTLADRKARLLLRVLALARGRPVAATSLVEVLWPDKPPARAVDQVAVLASRLRRELGREAVEHSDHGYRLRYDWLDADELAGLVTEIERRRSSGDAPGAASAARAALALLRGPLPPPAADVDWARADHEAVQRSTRRARLVAGEALLDVGDWLDALDLAEALLAGDRYDERAGRLLMLANALGGRPAVALAAYAELRERLRDELGTEPDPQTSALHTAILRGKLTPAPAPHDRLVGRAAELAALDRAASGTLGRGRSGVVTVVGEAGMGKSTLLRAWVAARRAQGDLVVTGSCGPLERSAPLDALLAALADELRGRDGVDRVLGPHGALLAPLLGSASAPAVVFEAPLGPGVLFGALTDVLHRLGGERGTIVVLDDAHLAGPALAEWASYVERRPVPVLVVVGVRPGEGEPFPGAAHVEVGPLDLDAAAELVGADRAADLHARSAGHPLFLLELAAVAGDELPPSLVDAVVAQCAALGDASDLVRAAATLGPDLDVELLAGVVGRPVLDVLGDLERAEAHRLLVQHGGRYAFRHELVREALAAHTRGSRAALLHREASRHLSRRPDADPLRVAEHARLGGELAVAAAALRSGAQRATERFDHATAEELLDQALHLDAADGIRLDRARVRILRERYAEAELDALGATHTRPDAWEVAAWAAYFDRRFDDAVERAEDGASIAPDDAQRARCLVIAGRTLHARGDLDEAHRRLTEAAETAPDPDRIPARAWLGVLAAHRSRPADALDLMRAATLPGIAVGQTSAALHALLFTGHAHAVAGRPRAALEAFDRYTAAVERRQVPRFAGRGTNFAGWVLRNVGRTAEGVAAHREALAVSDAAANAHGGREMRVAALEDLAEERLGAGDPDAAHTFLDDAAAGLHGDLVFGWRLEMKLALLRARLALLQDRPERALHLATELADRAAAVEVPRYAVAARLVRHRATAALGGPVRPDEVRADVAAIGSAMGIEAWWWAGETGAALGMPELVDHAEGLAAALAGRADEHRDALRREADRRLTRWRLRTR